MSTSRGGGFTLVEVVVALVILAVATAATTDVLLLAARDGLGADLRERAIWEATAAADSLSRVPGGGAGSRPLPGGSLLEWGGPDGAGWVRLRDPGADVAWLELAVTPSGDRATLGSRP